MRNSFMKKILSVVLAVVMLFAVVALAGCSKDPANNDDNKAATLKFGLGVVASYGEAKDTSGEFIATAGCTIGISDMIKAAETAAKA